MPTQLQHVCLGTLIMMIEFHKLEHLDKTFKRTGMISSIDPFELAHFVDSETYKRPVSACDSARGHLRPCLCLMKSGVMDAISIVFIFCSHQKHMIQSLDQKRWCMHTFFQASLQPRKFLNRMWSRSYLQHTIAPEQSNYSSSLGCVLKRLTAAFTHKLDKHKNPYHQFLTKLHTFLTPQKEDNIVWTHICRRCLACHERISAWTVWTLNMMMAAIPIEQVAKSKQCNAAHQVQ